MTTELFEAAQTACNEIGVIFRQVATDGRFHQLDVADKSPRNGAGRIRLFPDGEGGQVWNHTQSSEPFTFWTKGTHGLSPAEQAERRQRAKEEREKAEALLAGKRAKAARLAIEIWKKSQAATDNPYLTRKQVEPTDTLRQIRLEELIKITGYHPSVKGEQLSGELVLIVPVKNSQGITTVEMIDEPGRKPALSEGQKSGCFWSTDKLPEDDGTGLVIGIGEGVATMLSYKLASGNIGIAALSCGNLKAVAEYFRSRYPAATIAIIADLGNGQQSAIDAAVSSNSMLLIPEFPEGVPGSDLNDVHVELGLDEAQRQVAEAMLQPSLTNDRAVQDEPGIKENPLEAVIIRLSQLTPLEYDRVRKDEAKKLEVRPATLDAAVKDARKGSISDDDLPFKIVDPWHEPIKPAQLLTDVYNTVRRFIICEKETAHAVALWAAMTWFIDVVQVAPLALITAPEKRCGKSQLLFLLGRLAARSITASSISPAALFRSIDTWSPTLLIDECDALLKDNEELRGLLNSGHTRDSAYCIRTVGENFTPTKFNTWGAKALAGIGHVADTLMDRSVILELRRKLPNENIERIRHAETGLFENLQSKLARFAEDYSDQVLQARPPLPESLNDRAQDNWEPLLAIAMIAGDDWLKIGTDAALKLSGTDSGVQTVGTELLSDIQEIFKTKKIERIFTSELIKALCADDEKMWATYNRGYPITPKQIGAKLKGYRVQSKSIRIGTENAKGYEQEQFAEAFSRYIPLTPVLNVTTSQPLPIEGLRPFPKRHTEEDVTDGKTCKTAPVLTCDVVTDKNGEVPVFNF